MDRTGIIVVTICAILLGLWFIESKKYDTYLEQQRALQTNTVVSSQSPEAVSPGTSAPPAPVFSASTNTPEKIITLTNDLAIYTFTSHGGGIKSIALRGFPETISPRWKPGADTNALATLNTGAPVPIMAVLGDPSLVGDGEFSLTKTDHGIEAEKPLPDGLVLIKDFHLGSNYMVDVTVTLKNESGKAISLPAQQWVVGTSTPMDVDDLNFFTYSGAMWFDGNTYKLCTESYFSKATSYFGIIPRTPSTQYIAGNGNVYWAAAYNQYFVILGMPRNDQPAQQIFATPVDLTVTNGAGTMPWIGVQTALVYPAQTLPASQVLQREIVLYTGPKELRILQQIALQFQNRADLVWNLGTGFATFWGVGSFFAKLLLWIMNGLHDLLPISYGWIIVVLTLLLRIVFWPLLAASIRSAKKMQALAPEIKALKEKYSDDPQKLMQKQTELWRKNGVNPMSGCLPALIQMPVFIGFFTMIRSAIELRGAHFLWIHDLSKADTLFFIPIINFPFNLLPLLMVGVMVWQAHLQPPSPGMDASQQKLMRYMPLIFLVFLYNYSAGMALYMTISTLTSVVQTRMIKNIAPAPAVSPLTPPPKKKK